MTLARLLANKAAVCTSILNPANPANCADIRFVGKLVFVGKLDQGPMPPLLNPEVADLAPNDSTMAMGLTAILSVTSMILKRAGG